MECERRTVDARAADCLNAHGVSPVVQNLYLRHPTLLEKVLLL